MKDEGTALAKTIEGMKFGQFLFLYFVARNSAPDMTNEVLHALGTGGASAPSLYQSDEHQSFIGKDEKRKGRRQSSSKRTSNRSELEAPEP